MDLKRTRQEAGDHLRGVAGGHLLQEIGPPEYEAPMSESHIGKHCRAMVLDPVRFATCIGLKKC